MSLFQSSSSPGTATSDERACDEGRAAEFLTKPLDHQVLLDAVHAATERDRAGAATAGVAALKARYHELRSAKGGDEPRRRGTGEQADRGRARLSVVTVKVHRGQVMRKMLAKSVAELVRMADRLGLPHAA